MSPRVRPLALLFGWTTGCGLFVDTGSFSSEEPPKDATPQPDGGTDGDVAPPDAAPPRTYLSCLEAMQAVPSASDGVYTIDPDGAGPLTPFDAYCDMTRDGGGWMLVSPAMLASEDARNVTIARSADERGGAVLRIFANATGCGATIPTSSHALKLSEALRWTRIRFSQLFAGRSSCWNIFGDTKNTGIPASGLAPFDPSLDEVRDAVGMSGSAGDAFAGRTTACDNESTNFWGLRRSEPRSATALLRRDGTAAAGPSTLVSCNDFGPGTSSPTWWEYRAIYIR